MIFVSSATVVNATNSGSNMTAPTPTPTPTPTPPSVTTPSSGLLKKADD
jgi:hypothetical protein